MFVNTIFYSVFFPSSCKGYSRSSGGSNTTCLASQSTWSQNSTCVWDSSTEICSVNPPPSSLFFYAEVAIIVTLFSLLPSAILDFIMTEYCSRRPVLESIGLESRDWLGRPSDPSENGISVARKSDLGLALLKEKLYDSSNNDQMCGKCDPLANENVKYVFCSSLSTGEEVEVMLRDVHVFLREYVEHAPMPWRGYAVNNELEARKEAIMQQLGVYPDGTPVSLSFFQKIYFGNSIGKLKWKLNKVRLSEKQIIQTLQTLAEGEEDMRDRCLFQYFVLEQLTPIKRYAVRIIDISILCK